VTETENPRCTPESRPSCATSASAWVSHAQTLAHPAGLPNAFATGRNPAHASVAFTGGILNLMSDTEIEGVVAHELGHVLHRDILISSVAGMLAAAITCWRAWPSGSAVRATTKIAVAAWWRAPHDDPRAIAAILIQAAISRSREYDADARSAKYVAPLPAHRRLAEARNLVQAHPHGRLPR